MLSWWRGHKSIMLRKALRVISPSLILQCALPECLKRGPHFRGKFKINDRHKRNECVSEEGRDINISMRLRITYAFFLLLCWCKCYVQWGHVDKTEKVFADWLVLMPTRHHRAQQWQSRRRTQGFNILTYTYELPRKFITTTSTRLICTANLS